MWCFQGLEAMGRTGTGADDLVLCLLALGRWIVMQPKESGRSCSLQSQEAKGFLARLSK